MRGTCVCVCVGRSFVEHNCIYILMEYVDGETLLETVTACAEKRQRLPEAFIWDIFVQLTLGLTYLHTQKRVVHRDLTPSNVMVDGAKQVCQDPPVCCVRMRRWMRGPCTWHPQVKITDFGLAKKKNPFSSFMKTSVGTISYSCPEIVQNQVRC